MYHPHIYYIIQSTWFMSGYVFYSSTNKDDQWFCACSSERVCLLVLTGHSWSVWISRQLTKTGCMKRYHQKGSQWIKNGKTFQRLGSMIGFTSRSFSTDCKLAFPQAVKSMRLRNPAGPRISAGTKFFIEFKWTWFKLHIKLLTNKLST